VEGKIHLRVVFYSNPCQLLQQNRLEFPKAKARLPLRHAQLVMTSIPSKQGYLSRSSTRGSCIIVSGWRVFEAYPQAM
jgi:hypothetical protein